MLCSTLMEERRTVLKEDTGHDRVLQERRRGCAAMEFWKNDSERGCEQRMDNDRREGADKNKRMS